IRMIKEEKINKVYDKGKLLAEDKILNILVPTVKKKGSNNPLEMFFGNEEEEEETDDKLIEIRDRRDEIKKRLRNGELENRIIEIEVEENLNSTVEYFSGLGMEEFNINVGDMFGEFLPKKTKKRKVTIKEARKIIAAQEAQK